jgi:hypothetical protein
MVLNAGKKFIEIKDSSEATKMNDNQLKWYEREKFDVMKNKFIKIIEFMDWIDTDLKEADKLWIRIKFNECKNYFNFSEFYNSHMKQIKEMDSIDFTALHSQLLWYHEELKSILDEAKKWKITELKDSL